MRISDVTRNHQDPPALFQGLIQEMDTLNRYEPTHKLLVDPGKQVPLHFPAAPDFEDAPDDLLDL